MPVLSRPPGQRICVPELGISIEVLRSGSTVVKSGLTAPSDNAVKDLSSCFRSISRSPFSLSKGEEEKVADRPDEGVTRCFGRLEILNGVAPLDVDVQRGGVLERKNASVNNLLMALKDASFE